MGRPRGSGAPRSARRLRLPLPLPCAAAAALGLAALGLGLALGAWARGAAPAPQALLQGGASALEPPGLLPCGLSQEQPRHRRAAPRKRPRSRKAAAAPAWAAHYEVQAGASRDGILAEADGTIRGWAESRLNATSPLSYDPASGGFRVARPGLYYLYSQAHFDEAGTAYLKLEVAVGGALALRCLEQLPPPRPGDAGAPLRGCRLGGLLALPPAAPLALRTLPRVRLKPEPYLTYFGLFQVR